MNTISPASAPPSRYKRKKNLTLASAVIRKVPVECVQGSAPSGIYQLLATACPAEIIAAVVPGQQEAPLTPVEHTAEFADFAPTALDAPPPAPAPSSSGYTLWELCNYGGQPLRRPIRNAEALASYMNRWTGRTGATDFRLRISARWLGSLAAYSLRPELVGRAHATFALGYYNGLKAWADMHVAIDGYSLSLAALHSTEQFEVDLREYELFEIDAEDTENKIVLHAIAAPASPSTPAVFFLHVLADSEFYLLRNHIYSAIGLEIHSPLRTPTTPTAGELGALTPKTTPAKVAPLAPTAPKYAKSLSSVASTAPTVQHSMAIDLSHLERKSRKKEILL